MPKKIRFISAYFLIYLRQYLLVILLGIIAGSLIYLQRNRLYEIYRYFFVQNQSYGIEGLYTQKNLPDQVANLLTFGITSITENNRAVISPLIDRVESSDNQLTFTFIFKNNLYWQNGRKFKTSDLEIVIPDTTITKDDDDTLKIELKSPYSPLFSVLSKPLFYKKTFIGLGRYQVDNATYQDGYLKLLRISAVADNHQKIDFHFYPNSTDLFNAFKLAEVDDITAFSLDEKFNNWSNIKINPSISTKQYLAIFLNTLKFPDKQLRQAIAYATPKSDDKNKRCLGPVSPESWAYNSQVKPYNFNPTRAKELLEAEHTDTIRLITTDRKLLSMAEIIKKSWKDILSINVEITVQNQNIDFDNYDAILTYGSVPNDPDQYLFWHSTQNPPNNITHFNNSRIDKLLEEGRLVQDQLERKKIYLDFQKFLLEESPVIFLEFPTTYTISRVK